MHALLRGGLALAALPSVAAAHHSVFGRFESQRLVELEGEGTVGLWRNPDADFGVRAWASSPAYATAWVTWYAADGSYGYSQIPAFYVDGIRRMHHQYFVIDRNDITQLVFYVYSLTPGVWVVVDDMFLTQT